MPGDGASLSKNLTPAEFTRFRDYIHQHSGIYLEEMKVDSLRISLITRATRFGFCTLDEYYRLLTSDEAEFKELMNLVTINETSFFRFPAQFDALRDMVIPEIVDGKSDTQRTFRVWSAGCSTGEEPYSIAMTLLDSGLEGLGYDVQVLGTDVSTNALRKANEGVYPARALLSVPHAVVTRFFEPTATGHRVTDRTRSLIEFQYHNLIKEPYPLGLMGNWDVIFCRNVTIYFKLESTRRVVQNFYNSLNPGGYLFIGHSETLTSISDQFDPVELGGVFLYRRPQLRRRGAALLPERGTARNELRASRQTEADVEVRRASVDSKREPRSVPSGVVQESVEGDLQEPTLFDQARAASSDGRPRDVLGIVTDMLDADPDDPQAFLMAAYAHADLGDLSAALDECKSALTRDPLLSAARYILGIIHMRQEEPERAIAELKRTVYSDPDFVLAHLNLGNLYRAAGQIEDACRSYENALRALYKSPAGEWTVFLGGFKPDLLAKTCERSLLECRKRADNT
ncbi:MAG: CheR family methyltransferase [Actinomycetota bacterium]|nr:CheR family methyltransferase [Actinomycetota bacterium]